VLKVPCVVEQRRGCGARQAASLQAGASASQTMPNVQTDTPSDPNSKRVMVAPVGTIPMFMSDQSERMKRIRAAPLMPRENRFSGMSRKTGKEPSVQQWEDLKPGARKCYNLYRLETDLEIHDLGFEVFNSLNGNVTARAICKLMLLAYNLKDVNDTYVFGPIPATLISDEEEFDDISDHTLTTAHPTSMRTIDLSLDNPLYAKRVGMSFAYFAAALMRLYTKSSRNVHQIHNHLRTRFQNFYDFPFPLVDYFPENTVIDTIKSQIDVNVTLKNTFYNFLYAGEDPNLPGKQLKEFLYGIHTAYTGMHSYILFLKCMEAYRIDNIELANILYNKIFEAELNAIAIIFNSLYGTEAIADKPRQMWRFARIFDNRFFSTLQTKSCPLFTATLAHLYHIVIPASGNQSALSIAQISNMTKQQSFMAEGIATRAFQMLTQVSRGDNYKIVAEEARNVDIN
ncbi:hypothetical protein U1Q18_017734, partial [Sarracenia purpurea var. burkii]